MKFISRTFALAYSSFLPFQLRFFQWCPQRPIARPLRSCAMGCVVGAAAAAGSSTALCRPLDTPSYLTPYYLRDVHSRFRHYASVRKRQGGPRYMTVEDFVLAVLASPEKELKNPSIADDLRETFATFDANGDGFISFPEFRFLMSLLASRPTDVSLLFRIVADGGTAAISLSQFSEVLRGLTRDESAVASLLKPSSRRSGIVRKLFGDAENPRACTFEELHDMVHHIRVEIWKAEFRQYDLDRNDRITADEFSELLASQFLGSHLPNHIAENIRKLRCADMDSLSMDAWLSFNELMMRPEDLRQAVELYGASGRGITRKGFGRALAVAGLPLEELTADVVFTVFDRNQDGTIEMDEFLYIMQHKMCYQYRSEPRMEKSSLPARLLLCAKQQAEQW